jgi:uncharacterized protein YjbI with pentapeptide repeats
MAAQLKRLWTFLNTDIRELGKPADAVETGAEVSKAVLEFAIALGLLAAVPAAPIAAAGLSFVGIASKGVKLYREKTNKELTLEEWVAIASPLAYLESFNELVQTNTLLQQISATPVSEPVQQQIEKLGEFQLDEHLARNALTCFHESELAQVLNQLLSTQLHQAGIAQNEAQIVAAWVAWGTHRHLKQALEDAEDSVRQMAQLYIAGRQQEPDKYNSIDAYLTEQIAAKPREKVFAESFTFRDIYVPLKAKPVNQNGEVYEEAETFDLETRAKDILNDSQKQGQVMFIQAGPGRGKSVFCRMFADWVRQHWHPIWTPVLIRLRDIPRLQSSFRDTLREAVQADFAASDDGWLTDRNTRFLFLLDGFDELVMEGRSSGLEEFLKQVGQFQQDCQRSNDMGHRVFITGRSLALHSIERFMPHNLERVEIQPMDDELQQRWFANWGRLVGAEPTYLMEILQDKRLPDQLRELAREPLLLYLIAAMHRDGELRLEMFEGVEGAGAKILIYEKTLDWVLTQQRPEWLNRQLTAMETAGLQRILAEAALCVVQSGGECASMEMVKERIKDNDVAAGLIEQAQERLGNDALKNALAAFYLQPAKGDKGGSVEFAHKSFSEFLFAQRLKESLEEWTVPGRKGEEFLVKNAQMHWEIYDLLGYGGLTPEIVEYLMGLLTTPLAKGGAREDEFLPVQLFKRLENFYLRWCDGEFIDALQDNYPQKKMGQLQRQGIKTGLRQVDVYAGLNVMILLLELHRYARSKNDLKNEIAFYPCGHPNTEGFGETRDRLLRIIGYSCCISFGFFLGTVGSFLRGADLRGADLSDAFLRGADLRGANLSDAFLSDANLSDANLRGADLRDAFLRGADLRDAFLRGADLRGADLRNAFLRGADLRNAFLRGADLRDAFLRSTFLGRADLTSANLTSADLRSANLRDANLRDANLRSANLTSAFLSGADLSGADLRDAFLRDAFLSQPYFGEIIWDEETKWGEVRGLETAKNVPEGLKQQLGLE